SLEGCCSTIELHPLGDAWAGIQAAQIKKAADTACCTDISPKGAGGGSWIRTNVGAGPTDLQSASFNHSDIPPKANVGLLLIYFSVSSSYVDYDYRVWLRAV